MPASAAVGVQSDGNAAEAETPVIGAAAATPKASSVTMPVIKLQKVLILIQWKRKVPLTNWGSDYPAWDMILLKRLKESLKGFHLKVQE